MAFFSVPKRLFTKAAKRNLIKRRMFESYRIERKEIESFISKVFLKKTTLLRSSEVLFVFWGLLYKSKIVSPFDELYQEVQNITRNFRW